MSMWYEPPTPVPPFVSVILKLTVWPWSTLMSVAKPCSVVSPAPPALHVVDGVPGFEFSHVITFQPGLLQGSVRVAAPEESRTVNTATTTNASRTPRRAFRRRCREPLTAGRQDEKGRHRCHARRR